MKRAWQLSQWVSSVLSRLGGRENDRTFPGFDPLPVGIALVLSIADSRSSGCSLNSDNLGKFNVVGLAAELAEIRLRDSGITMKICHVAALVLAGWCLMMPPPLSHSRDRLVPLWRWTTTGTFESKKTCEAERGHFSKVDPGAEVASDPPPADEVYDAECVATDDPLPSEVA
jgi:hypothetical protein